MAVPAIKLAMKGVAYGAEKIPDKFWESIPGGYYKVKEQATSNQHRSNRTRKHSDAGRRRPQHDSNYYDRDNYYSDDDYAPRHRSNRRRWSSVDGRGAQPRHVVQEEAYYPRKSNRNDWNDRNSYADKDSGYSSYNAPVQDANPYKPYNPADYAGPSAAAEYPPETSRGMADPGDYYRQQSAAETQYGPPAQESFYYENDPNGATEARQHSTYAPQARESYAPPQPEHTQVTRYDSSYVPHADAGAYYTGSQRPSELYRRESYSQPVSRSGSRPRSRGRRRRSDDGSRSPSRRSKSRGLKERIKHMDDDDRKLAATLGGAAGGGLLVNGLTHNSFGALLGAAIGGLAARGVEKKEREKRAASRPRRDSKLKANYDGYDSYDSYSDDGDRHRHPDGRRRRRRDSF